MKKISLFILSIFAVGVTLAQTVSDFSFVPQITDKNMSIVFPSGTLDGYAGGLLMAFDANWIPVGGFGHTGADIISENGSVGTAVWGSDQNYDYLSEGEEVQFAILMNDMIIVNIDVNPLITYQTNDFITFFDNDYDLLFSIDGAPVVIGCSDPDYLEYQGANLDDGSCATLIVLGCMDANACNFNSQANIEDASCTFADVFYDCNGNCLSDIDGDGICDELEISGCTDSEADNYDSLATDEDNSCIYYTPISFQLSSGWNMVGYTGTADNNGIVHQMDAALVNGAGTANTFQVIKNVSGAFWSAAFAQITEFIPGEGYMMFVNGDTTTVNFQHTSGYISDIEYSLSSGWNMVAFTGDIDSEKNIVNAMDAALENGAGTANTFQVIKNVSGAFWSAAFAQITEFTPGEAYMMFVNGNPTTVNFNSEANMADGNFVEYAVGMEAEGGIVFYVDETGEHGLVAAMEDLTEGATDPYGWGYNGYEWGCLGQEVNGADGQAIGTGYQNTMDIVNQGCVTDNGGITAAQAALDAEINGYSDWYLPSKDELIEMYNTIGNGSPEGNLGGFEINDSPYYWSSSENVNFFAWNVNFNYGNTGTDGKYSTLRVRVIRAF